MVRRFLMSLAAIVLASAGAARASEATALDWTAWQHLPVFENGRLMPWDTLARSTVELVCGRVNPTLALPEEAPESSKFAAARKLFPDGQPRKFSATELLLSWIVEPEKWERVPFLIAEHKGLRSEVLQIPVIDNQGRRLRYVSPADLQSSKRFWERLRDIEQRARSGGSGFRLTGVDKSVKELYDAFERFRLVTYRPAQAQQASQSFLGRANAVMETTGRLFQVLQRDSAEGLGGREGSAINVMRMVGTLRPLVMMAEDGQFSFEKIEPAVADFQKATADLAKQLATHKTKAAASLADELARQVVEMHLALYDNGFSPRLVPALSVAALEQNRLPSDDAHPWLSLSTLIYGSPAVLSPYPPAELKAVQQSFHQVAKAYIDRTDPQRADQFAAATDRFVASVRALAEAIEPLRQELPIRHRDEEMIRATAYPPIGSTDGEVHYNHLNPFFWSWVISLAALACLALSFGFVRKPLFWLGMLVLPVGQLFTVYGLSLRALITGWVPVTNMFETVVFVALVGAVLGLWFTLLPLFWPGLQSAWRLTAFPFRFAQNGSQPSEPSDREASPPWRALTWGLLLPRAVLTAALFYWLTLVPYWAGGYPIVSLLPKTDLNSSMPSGNNLLTWAVGLCVLVPTVWYLPRLALALLLSLVTVPTALRRQGLARPIEQTLARRPFAIGGAVVAVLAAMLAYFAPNEVLSRDISLPTPILRDNFWLVIHVLTITASYGAGGLAWLMGNVALGYYLLGRYRPSKLAQHVPGRAGRRPPEVCATLAGYVYKATQVAVLLLAAGTILGALWADVAWGRFWNWDAKEVWALISLLVYMIILHGRYIGWSGNFGLAVGSVLGATSIVWAWYGVNFFFDSGLHTYGRASGGEWEVGSAIVANWLFVLAAAIRYNLETHGGAAGDSPLQATDPDLPQQQPAPDLATDIR